MSCFRLSILKRGLLRLLAILFSRVDIFRDQLIEALSLVELSSSTGACCLLMKPTQYDSVDVSMIVLMQNGA
jgi:hypothetical protein